MGIREGEWQFSGVLGSVAAALLMVCSWTPKMPSTGDEQPRFHWLNSPFPWHLSKGGSSQTSELFTYFSEFSLCQLIWEMLMKVTS